MVSFDRHLTPLSGLLLLVFTAIISIIKASLERGQKTSQEWDAQKLKEREENAKAKVNAQNRA